MKLKLKLRNHAGIGAVSAVLLASALTFGCDTTTPTPTSSSWVGTGMGPNSSLTTLTAAAVAAMDRAIQDEYHAEQTYEAVLADFGNLLPFANVVNAESRHSESIARIYMNHERAVPESMWSRDNVPRFGSVPEACAAAAVEERKNITMYDELLRDELPLDVRTVFSNNREASLSSHLPAFERCALW